jgi:hypothetical protein
MIFGGALVLIYPVAWWWLGDDPRRFVSFALGAPAGMLIGWCLYKVLMR